MILATDNENTSEQRAAARPAHLERLKVLEAQGRLLTAGPNPLPEDSTKMSGSLIIADFDDVDAGVYAEVLIKPYKKVFPQ